MESLVGEIRSQSVLEELRRRQDPLLLWNIKSMHSGILLLHLIAQEVTDPVVSEVGLLKSPTAGSERGDILKKQIL